MINTIKLWHTAAFVFLGAGFISAQQLYLPGNNHTSTINNRGIGIGLDNPDAKLHIKDRVHQGTALYLDIGTQPRKGGGWDMSDYALKVTYERPNLSPTVITTLSIDKDGKIQSGFWDPTITDQIAARGNIGVHSNNNHLRMSYQQSGPQLQWKASANENFGIINEDTGTIPFRLTQDGKIGINTNNFFDNHDLFVKGSIYIEEDSDQPHSLYIEGSAIAEEMFIKLKADWPDYVFADQYNLMPLDELKHYIEKHGHLPDMPKAEEVKRQGMETGETIRILTEKVEELTLYILQQQKEINALKQNQKDRKDETN